MTIQKLNAKPDLAEAAEASVSAPPLEPFQARAEDQAQPLLEGLRASSRIVVRLPTGPEPFQARPEDQAQGLLDGLFRPSTIVVKLPVA